jgi:hypothetical protein
MRRPLSQFAPLAALALFAAACSEATLPTAPAATLRSSVASLDEGTAPAVVMLCKIGPAGTSATFSVASTGGELRAGSTVTVSATSLEEMSTCVEIWRATALGQISTVTVTEVSASPGTKLEEVAWYSELDGWGEGNVATQSTSVRADWGNEAIIWFKNTIDDTPPPPPPGLAGCTPGFWRQSQHYAYWAAPYSPTTAFSTVFANAFPGQTLGQVVQNGGGGLNALGRHTVAALLNSASAEVDYGMTPAEVIAAFNAAYASGSFEAQKNIFEGYNERGCTVDKSGATSSSETGGKGKPAK